MQLSIKNFVLMLALLQIAFFTQARKLIIVGIPAPPMRYLDTNKQPKGFDIDVLDHILNKLGHKYVVVLIDSSPRVEIMWKKGDMDILMTYSYKKERVKYLIYPKESHVTVAWNFFIRKEDEGKIRFENYSDLKKWRVGASSGKSYTKEFWEASKSYPFIQIIPRDNLQLNKLINKRVDIVPLETISALYKAHQKGISEKITYLKKPLKIKPYYNLFVKASTYPSLNKLVKKYDEELFKMKQDNTLKKLKHKYYFAE
ncbi:transporter substrate-binding domain-containing protein [Endozoicomonas sp. SM1973]|uniref:Transporter substrate-binding domain-containing protein n=1 Tax=Spartinivicinus marinus TaxID=2994442 RepID=A0A853IDZ0_9GAMM|nr:transporter substrate-binding domain-containing protein [Spartinivicinus marinus]MCX4026191.1 transporter substrate-binding domain-containing protein [Spartinivicinus marinus]NYZ67395.1 transporter substrate-binding domain-containing protein [Spartinivicinus marinus]